MPTSVPPEQHPADGDTSVTVNFWLTFHKGPPRSIRARYTIECNRCGHAWAYDPPQHEPGCSLPLTELQCPNDCENRDTDLHRATH